MIKQDIWAILKSPRAGTAYPRGQDVPAPVQVQAKGIARAHILRQASSLMQKPVSYRIGNDLDLDRVIELYRASTLGERRPVDDRERMGEMLRQANLVITAWEGDLLVGIARSVSDFVYCTYLSDLAVRQSHQRQGIGRELIRHTQQAASRAAIILLAAPKAVDYYPRIGFKGHPSCWTLEQGESLR